MQWVLSGVGKGWGTCNGCVRGEKLLLFRGEQGWEHDGTEKASLEHSWSLPGPSLVRWKAWESSTGIAARSVVGQGWSRGCAIHPSIHSLLNQTLCSLLRQAPFLITFPQKCSPSRVPRALRSMGWCTNLTICSLERSTRLCSSSTEGLRWGRRVREQWAGLDHCTALLDEQFLLSWMNSSCSLQHFASFLRSCLDEGAVSSHHFQVTDWGAATCPRTGVEWQSWNWEKGECQ